MDENKKTKTRDMIEEKYKWKIEKVYKNTSEWEKDLDNLKKYVPKITEYSGKLGDGEKLLEFYKIDEEASRLAEKLYVYAHQRYDEDTTNTEFQTLKSKIDSYLSEFKSAESFFIPEILALPEGLIQRQFEKFKDLKKYEFAINDILKMKPHVLSKKEEKLLAAVSDCLEAPGNIFSMLSNADMKFPNVIDEDGNEVELTEVKYGKFIKSKNREVRKRAFNVLFNTYKNYKNTFAEALSSSVKNFVFQSKVRNYKNSMEYSLTPNDIPLDVYNNLIEAVDSSLKESLHRYVKIKKKLLKLDEIHMYDLYVPIVDNVKEHIEFEDAVKIVKEGLKPLGEEYLQIFQQGVNDGWIDVFENVGKRGGAYSFGSYDTMPYVLLNYNYEMNDVSTLAHEMGHSIHSYYSRKNQPYIYANYSLFCAEVASTTNESLLINHLINNEKDKNKKMYLINQQLEQIRTTVFRQVMFAEFEKTVHEGIESGSPFSGEDYCRLWHELNVKYFGPEMFVDEEIDMEWARIPHFYSDFYVYQYATGYSAANSFSKMILDGEKNATEKYKEFLKSGSSDYPIEVLKRGGVDMTTSKPLNDTIDTFNKLLDMLDKIQ
ncbi:oligopeptidase F. Metallo peptidase. MEROPS family M03B [Clostridium acidisoli DSM 12555]|uniref:Oligopeptidase F n=1 Tax=Clostridium acidisoli DSM 12555 TaxID=1121291 RepID=A0A1W1XPP5_9CLOT|nr:oligoendopeptidase F [Clostridium acidisoli]SMC25844.1 oligopeptidase F. Metallo peptidase. MEROPS family M03B [Clostridium acidisoli DSM 12555]